ncbi:MAG TPA: S-layer homology domain-containing protein [Candidatus Olsenella avicola]|nr:S-layer homology domain-containing protein [Candidatus Olsenella avicola]
MTACTNNGGSRARRAVTAALVGVLSVGAAPMVALATEAAPVAGDVQLQAATDEQAFMAGTVAGYTVGDKEVEGSDPVTVKKSELADSVITITSVTPEGEDAKAVKAEGDTYYYQKTDSPDTGSCIRVDGTWYKWVDQTFANLSVGDYIALATFEPNTSIAPGEYDAPVLQFSVVADSLEGAKVMKDLGNDEYTDELTWESGQNWDDLVVVMNGKEITSADFAVYAKNQDTGDLKTKEILPGTYEVVITGSGDYDKQQVKYDVTVGKLDLADLGLTLADVKGDTAPTFDGLKSQNADAMAKLGGVATSSILDFSIDGKTWETGGLGEYTYTLSVKDGATVDGVNGQNGYKVSDLVEGTAEITFNRVSANASSVDWTYDGKDISSSTVISVDASAEKDDLDSWELKALDLSKFGGTYTDVTTLDEETLASGEFGYTIKNAKGEVVTDMSKKGTYYVTLEAKPSELGWNVERTATTVKVMVKAGTVGTADTVFTFDGEVTQAVSEPYDGQDFLARLGILVKDSEGNVLEEGVDYEVEARNDATNEVVTEIVDQGTYTVTVSSDSYEFDTAGDSETIKVTVETLNLDSKNTRVSFPTSITYTTGSGDSLTEHTFIPYTGEEIVPVVEVALTADEDGEPVWTELDSSLYDLTFGYAEELDNGVYKTEKTVDSMVAEGYYKVSFAVDSKETKNVAGSIDFANPVDGNPIGYHVADTKVFVDVPNTAYYAQPIYTAVNQGYIVGLGGSNMFGPDQSITRADMVCVLYRMAGGSVDDDMVTDADKAYLSKFEDVDPNGYYAQAVAWATKAGIVKGYGTTFGTERNITTEEFVTMLARYADMCGTDVTVDVDEVLAGTPDGDKVTGYAREAMAWAVENGYVGKDGNLLDPQGNVSRGRAVTIAVRYQPEQNDVVGKPAVK